VITVDWRDAVPSDMAPLYAQEQEYWLGELRWDASTAWREIEQARVTWGLPGYLVLDAARGVRGWAYYLTEGDTMHLGGIVGDTAEATTALVDACLDASLRSPRPTRVSCFTPDRAAGLEAVLTARQFGCEAYHYLHRRVTAEGGPFSADIWSETDLPLAASLLQEAYGASGRHFAPGGTLAEWENYARSLVERPGCGVVEPAVSRVLRAAPGLEALVLATRIAPATLHLAQVAVRPSRRREGLARRLVDEACRAGAARGATEATLLVGDRNRGARALYAGMGFEVRARFVAGMLDVPPA
jgi:ribosomal protein S18 acetylase RimI-like enzyme